MELLNSHLENLTNEEKYKYDSVVDEISEQKRKGKLLEVFRGEDLENIEGRLNPDNINTLFDKLFYFGDKARHYSIDDFAENRIGLNNIADVSSETVSSIFDRVLAVVYKLLEDGEEDRVSREYRDFFLNPVNKEWFIAKFKVMRSESAKMSMRDYYLYFLHVAGKELDGIVKCHVPCDYIPKRSYALFRAFTALKSGVASYLAQGEKT